MRRLFLGLLVLLGLSLPGVARAQDRPTVVRAGAYINDVARVCFNVSPPAVR
jgi:hypothetical protein